MSKQSVALITVLVVITVGLVLLAVSSQSPVQLPTTTQSGPTPTPFAHSTLTLSPNPVTLTATTGSVAIMVDTSINTATAVQVELSYDPTKLTSVAVTPGTFFDNPIVLLKNVDQTNGKISYAIGIPPAGRPRQGQGTIATITFTSLLKPGEQTALKFLPKTLVTAQGVTQSVLKDSLGTTIIAPAGSTVPATGSSRGL